MVSDKLEALGLSLPQVPAPKGVYTLYKQIGEFIFVSGQGPIVNDEIRYQGRVGAELTLEEGIQAARDSALNILSILQQAAGSLDRVELVKLNGFVSSAPDFCRQPEVINGASALFLEVLGERGRHTRCALGTNVLPFHIPVEIEAVAHLCIK